MVRPISLASLAASAAKELVLKVLANVLAQQLEGSLDWIASLAQQGTSSALVTSEAFLATSGAMVLELWALAILRASLVTSWAILGSSLVSLEASGASLAPALAQQASLASLVTSQGGSYSQEGRQRSELA